MATHITTTAPTAIGPTTAGVTIRGIRITVNATLVGTITTVDGTGTVGIVTNPTVGASFIYDGLLSPVAVTSSAACDLTVSSFAKRN